MTSFIATLQTELLKIQKSKIIWITAAAFTIAPLMAGFFMFILKDPELAQSSGLVSAKAQIAGEATWPAYLNLYAQMIAVGGILVFGFVISWIFGREYTDNTIKDLLALPYSRTVIVIAKFVAAFIANILLSVYVVTLGFLIGLIIGLPQWSSTVIIDSLWTLCITTMLTIILSIPVAFFACFGRGYLAPLGFVIFMLVLSQIIAAVGYGEYFPWSIPALYSGLAGESVLSLNGIFIIFCTGFIGFVSTLYWWTVADQH